MSLKGKWRIVEMEAWDKDFLDMIESAVGPVAVKNRPGSRSPPGRISSQTIMTVLYSGEFARLETDESAQTSKITYTVTAQAK